MGAGAERDVVVDAHREWIRFLEHHSHALAQEVYVHLAVDVLAVEQKFAGYAAALNEVVHAVEGFQQRGFSAAGRPYERSYLVFRYLKADTLERLEVAVVKLGVPDIEFHMGLSFLFRYPALDKVGNEVY